MNKEQSLKAVAARCGVSAMTVSRALRGDPGVGEATRKRVMDAAGELNYHHANAGGRPRSARPRTRPAVDVVIGGGGKDTTAYYAGLLMSIEAELAAHSHDCVTRACDGGYAKFVQLAEALKVSTADGTLIVGYLPPEQLKSLLAIVPAAILVDNPGGPELEGVHDAVGFDNVKAALLGVRHLLRSGREKTLLLNGFAEHYFAQDLRRGYQEARRLAGLPAGLELNTDFTIQGAYEAIGRALDDKLDFDAVFTTDELACGVYRALGERGLRIPQDIAVCGCDGLPVGEQIYPRLTSVVLDYRELGRMAVERFLTRSASLSLPFEIKLPPRLEIRESA